MKDEELEVLKIMGDSTKLENLWIKVYDDEKKKDGLISMFEIIETMLESTQTSEEVNK